MVFASWKKGGNKAYIFAKFLKHCEIMHHKQRFFHIALDILTFFFSDFIFKHFTVLAVDKGEFFPKACLSLEYIFSFRTNLRSGSIFVSLGETFTRDGRNEN